MKNKKEFFGVLLSILVCVFLVFLAVYATTTVGDDITVGDDLIVTGLASVSETLRVPTIYGDTDGGDYLRIGDEALTSHSLAADDDLLVTGKLEVDGIAYFDGVASMSGTLWVDTIYGAQGDAYLRIGDEALASHSLAAEGDMLVTGKLEVDGTAFFDGLVSVSDSNGIQIGQGATIITVVASPSCDSCVIGSLFINTVLGTIHICDAANTCSLITNQ